MNIPDKLKIFGHEYEVVVNDEVKTGNSDFGSHWLKYGKIWINSDITQHQQESTLIHEILEAINAHLRLDLDHKQIFALETGLYQIIKDNGLLKEY